MHVHEITYAGGLGWALPLQALNERVEAEGINFTQATTPEEVQQAAQRVFEQIAPEAARWIDEREPYFSDRSLGIGVHDVTPEEMQDEGRWKYTLTVGQDSAQLRRQYIKPIEQPEPLANPEPEIPQQTEPQGLLKRWALRLKQRLMDAVFPPVEITPFSESEAEELGVQLFLGGTDRIWDLVEGRAAVIPDPALLFLGGYKRIYSVLTVEHDGDRDMSTNPLPGRRIPVPTE